MIPQLQAQTHPQFQQQHDQHHQQHQQHPQQSQPHNMSSHQPHQQQPLHMMHQHHHHHPTQLQQQPQQQQSLQSQQLSYPTTMEQVDQQQSLDDSYDEVMQQLMILVRETLDTDQMVQNNRDIYQDFVIQFQARSRMISAAYTDNLQQFAGSLEEGKRNIAAIEKLLKTKAHELHQVRRRLVDSQMSIFNRLLIIQDKILLEYLPQWHIEQQLLNNGVKLEPINLDLIQSWVEKIVEIIWRIKNQIKGMQLTMTDKPNVPFTYEDLDGFVVRINKALESLILSSFVVEKQPPQVMKTNTRFTATVRFLCGNKLNVQMINPTVTALIMSEQNARTVIKCQKELIERSRAFGLEGQGSPHDSVASSSNNNIHDAHQHSAARGAQHAAPRQGSVLHTNSTPMAAHTHQQQQQPPPQQVAPPLAPPPPAQAAGARIDNFMQAQSPDQLMSMGENQSPTHQQFFQQQHHPPQQHFHQQQSPIAYSNLQQNALDQHAAAQTITNMTTQPQQYGVTEIGYNPNAPASSKDFECSSEILNNNNVLEYHEASCQMISHFRNMQLKKIKRTEKKGTESVMDEKFILLFFTEFRIADDSFWPHSRQPGSSSRVKRGDLLFHILAYSLPVVVIVHGNQEPHAWATITWHNAFARPDEVLYRVPDRVPWRDLGHVLSEKFRSHAGRGLSAQNLKYLANKVCRGRAESDDTLVTWVQFSKEPMSDKSFTFWEWFHSILKLTRDHLSPMWKAERIYGFIGKKGCVDLLLGSAYTEPTQAGTFILRFSETELGGITMAWVSSGNESNSIDLNDRVQISQRSSPSNASTNVVMHLEPFVSKCLSMRSLADRIRDLKDLVYLYPNIPKDEAFEAYYTPIVVSNASTGIISSENYVRSMLVTTLARNYPGSNSGARTLSVTPSSISQSSPEAYNQDAIMGDPIEYNYHHQDHDQDHDHWRAYRMHE